MALVTKNYLEYNITVITKPHSKFELDPIIILQGCASHPQPGGGSPPDLAIFENWGGGGGEFFSKIISFI